MSAKTPIKSPKKLIEVALPLDAINAAAAREKSIRHGHPSTLHLWWARRPLAAARAVIFGQMVNDPSESIKGDRRTKVWKETVAKERERLFKIIEDLVKWENTSNEEVLGHARAEILRSWREVCELNKAHPQAADLFNPDKLPAFHDPFAGGGALPLEAQRLGLESFASDLNPVAVTINKAMIEIPPRFAGRAPVGPSVPSDRQTKSMEEWPGARGLAEDVRRYGAWMRAEAEKRIGHLYPQVEITAEMVKERPDLKGLLGQKLTVIAWLWARTVKSPNPAFSHVDVPLVSTFVLSSKTGKESYVQPVVEGDTYRFTVKVGKPPEEAKAGTRAAGRGANFRCVLSDTPISGDYIKAEGQAGRMGSRLMAIVAEGTRGRVYLPSTRSHEEVARKAQPSWKPEVEFFQQALGFRVGNYGLTRWSDLFTPRQLTALATFSDLVGEAIAKVKTDAMAKGGADEGVGLANGGSGAAAYAQAVGVYLAFAVDKGANYWSSLCSWHQTRDGIVSTFGRQTLPIVWDYAEANPVSDSSGNFTLGVEQAAKCLELSASRPPGIAIQDDATEQELSRGKIVSTDPPYYDNIGYADLSDFFYVWLRRSIGKSFPELYATIQTPKGSELVATPARHGGKAKAETFFLTRMSAALSQLAQLAHPAYPVTIYYAFKQSETENEAGTFSTGWETFLQAVVQCGFSVGGTWPVRTEYGNKEKERNALASSIVLVCRQRLADAPTVSRREFIRELNAALPEALDEMTRGGVNSPVAPVDLSQAIIGPGMAIFSKYAAVLEADGTPMRVRTALQLINRFLAEDDFDHDTQFCLHWFNQYGWSEGAYGEADVLARAKATGINGLSDAGVLKSGAGKVRLLRPNEYPSDWDPRKDPRIPIWEMLHQLIRALRDEGETGAGKLLAELKPKSEAIRQLAYRLYTLCERKGQADDARAYNELVTSWSAVESAAGAFPEPGKQFNLFGGNE